MRRLVVLVLSFALAGVSIFAVDPAAAQDGVGSAPDSLSRIASQSSDTPEGLQVVVDERGLLSHSVDATGTTAGSSSVTPMKPPGATLRRAAVFVASTGFTGPASGSLSIDGADVPLTDGVSSSISSMNYWADVSDLVRAKADSAPAGPLAFEIAESASSSIDGVVLSLIWDDPSIQHERSVALLFGAMQTSGDQFVLNMAQPIDPNAQGFVLEMGLGISFGYQSGDTGQYSTVEVNDQPLTSSAGGQDDGGNSNGSLITVGGVGDSEANPPDPLHVPSSPTYDDELYDLAPFVEAGDTRIVVETANPSNDDNVFFAHFTTNPPVSSIVTPGGQDLVVRGLPITSIVDGKLDTDFEIRVAVKVELPSGDPAAAAVVAVDGEVLGVTGAGGKTEVPILVTPLWLAQHPDGVATISASLGSRSGSEEVGIANFNQMEWSCSYDGPPQGSNNLGVFVSFLIPHAPAGLLGSILARAKDVVDTSGIALEVFKDAKRKDLHTTVHAYEVTAGVYEPVYVLQITVSHRVVDLSVEYWITTKDADEVDLEPKNLFGRLAGNCHKGRRYA